MDFFDIFIFNNGMPDLVADNYLKRWNGDEYESFEWDGKKLKSAY